MVLVVDDTEASRRLLKIVLSTALRIDVMEVESAKDALQILATQRVCAVVSDVRMPSIDGLEFLQICKSKYDVPFFLVSTEPSAFAGLELPSEGVFDKSNIEGLIQLLSTHLKGIARHSKDSCVG